MGTHGRSGLDRLLLGSVAREVLTHSHASVLVAREPVVRPQVRRRFARRGRAGDGDSQRVHGMRLILATDGSAGARTATDLVASLPWPVGTEVEVVAVTDTNALLPTPLMAVTATRKPLAEAVRDMEHGDAAAAAGRS